MSDLISRNALLDAMPKNDELLSVDVRRIICESPIIDAEPARHGRWETKEYTTGDGLDGWGVINHREEVCSECGEWQIGISNYCPNCGAKMDEGEQNATN